ncbi:MAG: hypothetical protein ABW352_07070 [Polyangiales bacterium]
MRKDEPGSDGQPSEPGFAGTCSVLLATLVCSIVVLASPRPVQPSRLPALRVPLAEAGRAFADDPTTPTEPLPDSPLLQRFLELYGEAGLNEREAQVDVDMVAEQKRELARITSELFSTLGEQGVRALRETLTARALAALPQREPPSEAYGLLGGFPALLLRYGYIDRDRTPLAPPRLIRNLYHQRFNLICEQPLDANMEPFDRRLAEGWVALHGQNMPAERRAQAARTFAELGGTDAREALAIWLANAELKDEAAQLLRGEYERTGALRLRNMLLFLLRS